MQKKDHNHENSLLIYGECRAERNERQLKIVTKVNWFVFESKKGLCLLSKKELFLQPFFPM